MCCTGLLSSILGGPPPMAPRQMSMAFESAVLQDLNAS